MDVYNSKIAELFGFFNGSKRYAVTLGQTAYFSVPEAEVGIRWHRHEDRHKIQWKEEGRIRFLAKYLFFSLIKGYTNNPYEVEARLAEN